MNQKWIERSFEYDGSQLRSLFAYLEFGLLGDSIVAWQGPCNIPPENIVDGEDLLAKAQICGKNMVHFIIEKFDTTLFSGVCLQRVLASLTKDLIVESSNSFPPQHLCRKGDDLFFDNRKLTISIASQSPLATMIHFAINVTNEGTPVPTAALVELNIEPELLAKSLMEKFTKEVIEIKQATRKVRWLK